MKILIVTIYYNRAQQVKASVESLLKAAPLDASIVLVDDGSTDNTLKELKAYQNDERVSVRHYANQGFSKSLKQTIDAQLKENDYEYISVVGSGDICDQRKFNIQLNYLNEQTDIVALGTGHTVISYTTKQPVLNENKYYEATKENLKTRVPFTHGTVVYRTSAYKKSDGYHDVFKYSQDKDLYFRLIDFGRIVRYPESLYVQYTFEDSASSNPKKKREQIKYQHLIFLNQKDKQEYEKALEELNRKSIHQIFNDDLFLNKYKDAQKRLIYQGEFKLAAQWADIISESENNIKHKMLEKTLIVLDKSKMMKKAVAKLFYYTRKILR